MMMKKKDTTNTAKNPSSIKSNQTKQIHHAPRPISRKFAKVKDEIFSRDGRNA
jgi:hypothetical protein